MAQSRIRQIMAKVATGTPASQIIRALSQRGAMTAAQIARQTGLAPSTISTAVAELKASRIVVAFEQADPGRSGAGRPGILLTLNPDAGICMGIHLSYDEIQMVVADLSHTFISERKVTLGLDYGPEAALAAAQAAFDDFFKSNGLAVANLLGVGVSVSGPVRSDGVLMRGGILPKWAGVNIRECFGTAFKRPVITDNESNCAAVAEMKWGAARGRDNFALFKMDVGVGGAIVCNGEVVRGVAGGAGEFGHVSINPDGELCRCGNRGCLELYASFVKPLEQLSRIQKRRIGMDDAIALAESGDTGALRMIADVGEYGGRGLAMIGTMLNPPLILVGGRLALAGDLLLTPMKQAYQRHTLLKPVDMKSSGHTLIQVGKFTENDSLLGAVGLVLDRGLSKSMSL